MSRVCNAYEIKLMREGGKIAALALKNALASVRKGIKEVDVDKVAADTIYQAGADLSYKTVPGYSYATCITVNEQVVHGIPTQRRFQEGDLVSVDLAVLYKGWHTDVAWTVLVGKEDERKRRFLKTGEEALLKALQQAKAGNRIGDIGASIQAVIEGAGYSVVKSLVGHGVGRQLHEDPEIPGYGISGTGMLLKPGMTLAIEVIYTEGTQEVLLDSDGWTFLTADGLLAGLFEMTVLVGKHKAEVLTDFRNT